MVAKTHSADRHASLSQRRERLRRELRSGSDGGSAGYDPDDYVAEFRIEDGDGYGCISPDIRCREAALASDRPGLVGAFNRYLTLILLEKFEPGDGECALPRSVVDLYQRDLRRIEAQLDSLPEDFYMLRNDSFIKDLAILSHRLIPVGAEYATPGAGVARSLILKKDTVQIFRFLRACVFEAGGRYPYFELHAHRLALDDFNPAGWQETYARLAELLAMNPDYRGVTSTSWFLDPQLESISPHLAYLRRTSEEGGATMLFAGYDDRGESGALEKSTTRQRLFREGHYTPAIYTRIWPRTRLLEWVALR